MLLQDLLSFSRTVAGAPRRALKAATPQAQDLSQCQTPSNLTVSCTPEPTTIVFTSEAWF